MLVSIGYLDVKVTPEEIAAIKEVAEDANHPDRYLATKQLEYASDLARTQKDGLHTPYLKENGQTVCSCGLALFDGTNPMVVEDEQFPVFISADDLANHPNIEVDEIHKVHGHQKLPRCKDRAAALIYKRVWDEQKRAFIFTAFCQVCLDQVTSVPGKDARLFVREHNKLCKSPLPGEGGA